MSTTFDQQALSAAIQRLTNAILGKVANDNVTLKSDAVAEALASVTKTHVGLDQVENYPTATQAEAEAGTASNRYMTPLSVKQAVAVMKVAKAVSLETPTVTVTGVTNGMEINSGTNGSVVIGNRDNTNTHYESSTGNHYFYGALTAQNNVGMTSDGRLKSHVRVIRNPLEKIGKMRGVIYRRRDTGSWETGLIAQEVQKVFPRAVMVGTDKNQTLALAYGNMVGLLIEGIKELTGTVQSLQQKVEALEASLEEIKHGTTH